MKKRRLGGRLGPPKKDPQSQIASAFNPKNITRLYTTPQLKGQQGMDSPHLLDDLRNQVVSSNLQIRHKYKAMYQQT